MAKYILGFYLNYEDYDEARKLARYEGGKPITNKNIPEYLTRKSEGSQDKILFLRSFSTPRNIENFLNKVEEENIEILNLSMCCKKK